MANEIRIEGRLKIGKGSLKNDFAPQFIFDDLAGSNYSASTQTIPTTAGGTALIISAGVATPGWAYFRNLDADNFITVGVKTGGTYLPFMHIPPGKWAIVKLATLALYALADTAAVQFESYIYES